MVRQAHHDSAIFFHYDTLGSGHPELVEGVAWNAPRGMVRQLTMTGLFSFTMTALVRITLNLSKGLGWCPDQFLYC